MTVTDPFGLIGQVIDGTFRVDEVAGEGGFSVVYRGFHTGLGETLAIKCLKLPAALGSALVESFMVRFRDEGKRAFNPVAAQSSLSTIDVILASCKKANGTGGNGNARVTFVDDGSVKNASVDAPFDVTPEGECAAARFRTAHVPPFQGPPVTVEHPFHIPK